MTATVTLSPEDKIGAALDRRLGLTAERFTQAAGAFSERTARRLLQEHAGVLRAHREHFVNDAQSIVALAETLEANPFQRAARVAEGVNASTWSSVLGAGLGRRLLAAYAEADYGERSIMRAAPALSLRPQRAVGLDNVQDIPPIDPESADYTELVPAPKDWEIPYVMLQKGIMVTFTRRVFLNDDVGAIQRTIDNLGRAARRTFARKVWEEWVGNVAYQPDGLAWFHGTHANLQTTALSAPEVKAAIKKLLLMTEPGSNERMGGRLRVGRLWLVVPIDMWDTAFGLNQTQGDALHHLFGAANEHIIVNPLLIDTNDWGLHRDSDDVESIRASFLHGREEPEFLAASGEMSTQMWSGDKLQYKLRHEYGVTLAEFRGAVKAVVP